MRALELKIPPPVIALLTAGTMWGVSHINPLISIPAGMRNLVAILLAALGVVIMLAAVLSFRRVQTSINPMRPKESSTLVSNGVFGISRNPMYLGSLFLLVAWAIYLSSVWTLVGPFFYLAYITRFQIMPEEKALSRLFGSSYVAYKAKVRRWL